MIFMANEGRLSSFSAVAYTVAPSQNNARRRPRLMDTKLYSSAPAVNGLAAHEHSHSTSLFNVGYDSKSIINFYDQRPWEVGLRLNMLGLPLLGKLLRDMCRKCICY